MVPVHCQHLIPVGAVEMHDEDNPIQLAGLDVLGKNTVFEHPRRELIIQCFQIVVGPHDIRQFSLNLRTLVHEDQPLDS